MPEEVVYYVTNYGYLAIFILVFLQEIGVPNPFPNELLLMFSGYLSFKGLLFLPFVVLTAMTADFIGTNILYFLFYKTGIIILQKKPKWFPLSTRLLERLTSRISHGGKLSIFIFRLTPFTRGYTSVITGLLQVKPKVFLPIAFYSAGIWSMTYVLMGNIIGPSWNLFTRNFSSFKNNMLLLLLLIMALFIFFLRRIRIQESRCESPDS
jgi:membrane protein DedA with SNARE-associated domain